MSASAPAAAAAASPSTKAKGNAIKSKEDRSLYLGLRYLAILSILNAPLRDVADMFLDAPEKTFFLAHLALITFLVGFCRAALPSLL